MSLNVIYERVDPIVVNLNNYLTNRNISLIDDVTEAVFMVKNSASDSDEDALVTKTLLSGITRDVSSGDKLIIQLSSSDFGVGAMEVGQTYQYGVGIKTSTTPVFLEPKLFDNKITITQDFIRG